ncbi:plk plk-unclassified protein kinase [Botrytis cinerea]
MWEIIPLELEILDIIGCVLSRFSSSSAKRDRKSPKNQHAVLFFTDYRTIQAYCAHDGTELKSFHEAIQLDLEFRRLQIDEDSNGQIYARFTKTAFKNIHPCLIWEQEFPCNEEMDALSPRDVNTNIRTKPAVQKAAPQPSYQEKRITLHHRLTGRCLGKGGFAICYEGLLKGTRKKYALKIVKSHMSQKKMEQKVGLMALVNPMELCPNASLMDMVKKRKYLTEPEVRFYTVQIAGAIKYMHARGIIHRDLKMGNIFLDKDMNVKIGDFGLAALLMSNKDMAACRRTTLCGTPNYIAPEILSKNNGGHDHAVDIWSMGIIIFAMLTGKPPFQSATADEIYRRAKEREYTWPQHFVEEMSGDLLEDPPRPDQFPSIVVKPGKPNPYARSLKKLCIKCEVGPWTPKKQYTSLYKECALEEKAGLTPNVPLAEGIVYRPYSEYVREQNQQNIDEKAATEMEASTTVVDSLASDLAEASIAPLAKKPVSQRTVSQRAASQSFAAQQRIKDQPLNTASIRGALPRRPIQREANTREPAITTTTEIKPRSILKTKAIPSVPQISSEAEGRLAADMVDELQKADEERKSQELKKKQSTKKVVSLFSPQEKLEWLPGSKPDHILEGLQRLQVELDRALNSRSIAATPKSRPTTPAIVVKWVDYTNKYGLGYILSNGSVGCVFRETPAGSPESEDNVIAPSCIVIRDGERHLANRTNKSYANRHQIIPISGPNVEFYESKGERGMIRGSVPAKTYRVAESPEGRPGRLPLGIDSFDNRKREKICLWKKFGNYMFAYGRDAEYPYESWTAGQNPEATVNSTVITFYQRWGDVGCWGFSDGHFQFNFPDHTKVVLSADGFWSVESIKPTTRKRPEIDPMIQGLPQANDFRRKVEFIRSVVKEWVQNGGLGISDMEPKTRLRWMGHREIYDDKKLKHVWTTVGGRRGDERRVAWYDPRNPQEVIFDAEVNGVMVE